MTINQLAQDIHINAMEHGFWEGDRLFPETVALCHSELSEALEEARAGRPLVWYGPDGKPEGVAVELLDCVIRIFDYLSREGVDIEKTMLEKHEYNKGREYRHGKRF